MSEYSVGSDCCPWTGVLLNCSLAHRVGNRVPFLGSAWLSKGFQLYLCIINRNMSWGIVPTVLSNIGSRIIVSTKICIALLYYPPWWSPWWLVDILIIYPSWCMVTVRLHVRCLLCCHGITIVQRSVFDPVQQSSRRLKVLLNQIGSCGFRLVTDDVIISLPTLLQSDK